MNVQADSDDKLLAAMQVNIPESEYMGMRVKTFMVQEWENEAYGYNDQGRASRPGIYTGLEELQANGRWKIWMTDTDAERRDHIPFMRMAVDLKAERLLVNGLGLGMVIKAALSLPHTKHIDVVEIDERVIHLVGPWYDPNRVHIHHADADVQRSLWPRGTKWDVAWHDVWPDGSPSHKPLMLRLMRSYVKRVKWQGAWDYDNIMKG